MINSKPYKLFENWFKKAKKTEHSYPEGFTLATASANAVPSARIVLLKKILPQGFVFFTNYNSQKAKELLENPNAHMLFYWKLSKKQVRIKGIVSKTSNEISNEYWASREYSSNLNAALSQQSSELEEGFNYKTLIKEFHLKNPKNIIRPKNWGGFIINPEYFEFWENGDHRWHKRDTFTLGANGNWKYSTLYP